MDIRQIVDGFAVAPQVEPGDMAELAALGYTTVICNRPDIEVPPGLSSATIRAAAEANGLRFVDNPVSMPSLDSDTVSRQADAAAGGPALAYCASGTRSAVVWALSQAGRRPTEEILEAIARAGYPFEGLRSEIDRLADGF